MKKIQRGGAAVSRPARGGAAALGAPQPRRGLRRRKLRQEPCDSFTLRRPVTLQFGCNTRKRRSVQLAHSSYGCLPAGASAGAKFALELPSASLHPETRNGATGGGHNQL